MFLVYIICYFSFAIHLLQTHLDWQDSYIKKVQAHRLCEKRLISRAYLQAYWKNIDFESEENVFEIEECFGYQATTQFKKTTSRWMPKINKLEDNHDENDINRNTRSLSLYRLFSFTD